MPMYDRECPECGYQKLDSYEKVEDRDIPYPCALCDTPMPRVWLAHANGVIADSIPGGVWIRNGLCNADGSPRKYYSHSEMKKEADKRGLVNLVEHKTNKQTDKSRHTSRWV